MAWSPGTTVAGRGSVAFAWRRGRRPVSGGLDEAAPLRLGSAAVKLPWPLAGAVDVEGALSAQPWSSSAEEADAGRDALTSFPWQDSEHVVAHMIGWGDAELMKNGAEIGQLRMLRAVDAE